MNELTTPTQHEVFESIRAGRHRDPAVVAIADIKEKSLRKREAKDLRQRILNTPNHQFYHPEMPNHLDAVEDVRLLGYFAYED